MLTGMAGTPLTPVQLIGIQAATEGNPLFVEHSYLYMAESEGMLGGVRSTARSNFTEEDLELAQSVRGLIGRRLERLSEPAHRMLIAAAVIGRDFETSLLEAFGELSGRELREALDEATRGRLLTPAGTQYRFSHDLVRQRVLAGMPLPRLQAYHLAVADTLERVYGKNAKEHAAEIAFHLYQAGTAAAAVRTTSFIARAARNALAVAAFEEALNLVERELLLLPGDRTRERAEALATKSEALFGLGRKEDAKSALSGAIQRYEEIGDKRSAGAGRARMQSSGEEAAPAEGNGSEGPAARVPEAPAAPTVPADEGEPVAPTSSDEPADPQDTSRAANGTGA